MVQTPSRSGVLLMSLPEIAELAGVRRPVVTTWRRRHPGFPAPVSSQAGRPLFDGREVCSWLVETGRAQRAEIEPDLRVYALAALAETTGMKALLGTATALLCLHHVDGEPLAGATASELTERATAADPDDLTLRSEITGYPAEIAALTAVVDELIEAAWGARPAFERVLALTGRVVEFDRIHPQLTRLMAELSGVAGYAERSGSVLVADPAAGLGDLLLVTVAQVNEAHEPVVLVAEPDEFLARLLLRRLRVHDIPTEDITVRPRLAEDTAAPDVIVTALPYRPAETRSPIEVLNALDDLAVRLAPGRTAVVLGPAWPLTAGLRPYSPEERLRAALLAGGMVEAILRLPGGMVPSRPGYDTALWVLTGTSDGASPGWVLLGDVSDQELSTGVVDACVADVVTWRRDGHRPSAHTRTFCIQRRISELVERPQPLTPRALPSARERAVVLPETVARVTVLEATLARFADPSAVSRTPINSGLTLAEPAERQHETIAALGRKGWLRVGKGNRIATAHLTAHGHHRVLGADELRSPATSRMIDRAVLAADYPRAVFTEPDDVLVTLTPEPAILLDERGFSVIEFPVRRLRVTAEGRDRYPPRVLAALLEVTARARTMGAVRAPRKLLDWELPVLEAHEAGRLDALLAAVGERRQRAQAELGALDELWRIAATGIANATLTFPR
jgi:hypothetical protein